MTRLERLNRCIRHVAQESMSGALVTILLQVVENVGAVGFQQY